MEVRLHEQKAHSICDAVATMPTEANICVMTMILAYGILVKVIRCEILPEICPYVYKL